MKDKSSELKEAEFYNDKDLHLLKSDGFKIAMPFAFINSDIDGNIRDEKQPFVVHLDTNKKILASQLGVTGETFSRTLAKFREEGLIFIDGPNISLLNLQGIRNYIDH